MAGSERAQTYTITTEKPSGKINVRFGLTSFLRSFIVQDVANTRIPGEKLTAKKPDVQMETLRLIRDLQRESKLNPALEELAAARKVTKAAISKCVNILVRKGLVTRKALTFRSIAVTRKGVFALRKAAKAAAAEQKSKQAKTKGRAA